MVESVQASRVPLPTVMLRDGGGDELLRVLDRFFERKSACQAGRNRGRVSAARPMGRYPSRERRRELNDISASKKEIDRILARQMTTFEQYGDAIFFRQPRARAAH